MKKLLIFCSLLFLYCGPASAGEREDSGPFSVTGRTIHDTCLKNAAVCGIWIQGVMEGMEFARFMASSSDDLDARPSIFCYGDEDYDSVIKSIQMKFMKNFEKEEYQMMLDKPAVFSLAEEFSPYLCRP